MAASVSSINSYGFTSLNAPVPENMVLDMVQPQNMTTSFHNIQGAPTKATTLPPRGHYRGEICGCSGTRPDLFDDDGTLLCINTRSDCGGVYWGDCTDNYETKGAGCAKHCIELGLATTSEWSNSCGSAACKYYFPDCLGGSAVTSTEAPWTKTNDHGVTISAHCQPKPELSESYLAQEAALCTKYKNNEKDCLAGQQYCDWVYDFSENPPAEYKRIPEDKLFPNRHDVIDARYSSMFGLFPPFNINGEMFGSTKDGKVKQPRKSRWVMWHFDVITAPPFNLLGCDCLEGERVEDPKGWFINAGDKCNEWCNRNHIGNGDKIFNVTTVHDKVCHREYDIEGTRWDPSPNMNYITPLNKVFPDTLGPDGLNMQRGEGGASWYWWGHTKPSWNDNDQTSPVAVGELSFDTEFECNNYGVNYWSLQGYGIKWQSVCEHFSSKTSCDDNGTPRVTNAHCSAACDGSDNSQDQYFQETLGLDFSKHPLNAQDLDKLQEWFHDNCMYTPYQPENDHAWPNFYVPETNSCFDQWQIGWEDQGCDGCMHPQYDNSNNFDGGWSYAPMEGSGIPTDPTGLGNCQAECGKIMMDGPGRPKDVKSAQECQLYCQNDSKCVYFQWRPIPDWDKAPEVDASGFKNNANKLNQLRSCLLKSKDQFEGALRARWGEAGDWLYDPQLDQYRYANPYQNNDCAQSHSGEGFNWCLACKEPTGDVFYHAFKWRNNMISGPKFCDRRRIAHGNIDRPSSPFFDPAKHPEAYVVPDCPAYDNGGTITTTTTHVYNLDGSGPVQEYCQNKPGLLDLDGGSQWAKHCAAAQRRHNSHDCERFQQYCDWNIYFKTSDKEYKRLTETQLGLDLGMLEVNHFSSSFGLHPPKTMDGVGHGGTHNKLPARDEKWVFWHYDYLSVQKRITCDCLEPDCNDAACSKIAQDADVTALYTLGDKVCHRESEVIPVRYDPSPSPHMMTGSVVYEKEWGEGLGMVDGEAGSSWYWYGHSKPSWNENDQTSYVRVGEKTFSTEHSCREYAFSYWSSVGFNNFLSVCEMFSSKTLGVSNKQCQAACDGNNHQFDKWFKDSVTDLTAPDTSKLSKWFKSNCMYTPYQGESDHVWPNFYVSESNTCMGQWQMGYEDQGCDGCIHDQYDNSADFEDGWSYGPVAGSSIPEDPTGKGRCDAQCGKFIMDGPGKPRDVKSAQECQYYCQMDERCVAFQWRAAPDYTAAASIDGTGFKTSNNRYNKVRSCALKDSKQLLGALEARWDASGNWVGDSDPSWKDGKPGDLPYNQFAQGEWAINDSQNSNRTGEGNNWYMECRYKNDTAKTTHSWKWRNNFISGPKYCNEAGTMRIRHGKTRPPSPFNHDEPDSAGQGCPTSSQMDYSSASKPPVPEANQDSNWPNLSNATTTSSTSTKQEGNGGSVPETITTTTTVCTCCNVRDYNYCQNTAWENWCQKGANVGCAYHCHQRDNYGNSCEYYHSKDVEYIKSHPGDFPGVSIDTYSSGGCAGHVLEAPTTTTSTTTRPKQQQCSR